MLEVNKIYNMDCVEGMKLLADESVDLVVTSPPYYQLRDYKTDGQIGLENTYQEYIGKLEKVFIEAYRALKPQGSCYVVISDTYAGNKEGITCKKLSYIGDSNIKKMCNGIEKKSLMLIPERFALMMIGNGWILRNKIIWHKPNVMPSSVSDRFTNDYECVYFFTKSQRYKFHQQKEPMITTDSYQIAKGVYIARKQGKSDIHPINNGRKQDMVKRNDYIGFNARYKQPEDGMRNKRAVWSIPASSSNIDHFAMFPKDLIEPMIKACSDKNDVILDPFIGSGTTAIVAKELGRRYIGFDINSNYATLAEKRAKRAVYQTDMADFMGGR